MNGKGMKKARKIMGEEWGRYGKRMENAEKQGIGMEKEGKGGGNVGKMQGNSGETWKIKEKRRGNEGKIEGNSRENTGKRRKNHGRRMEKAWEYRGIYWQRKRRKNGAHEKKSTRGFRKRGGGV